MKKQRIHNPQNFTWALLPGGAALDLTGKALQLYMRSDLDVVQITGFTVAENVISWTWAAAAQKYTGKYDAVLVEVTGEGNATVKTVIDVQAAVELVAHSWEVDELPPSVIELETLVSLIPGPEGPQGPAGNGIVSAEIDEQFRLVITYTNGDVWTSEHSLRGPQGGPGQEGPRGPQGVNGGLLYPTFRVDAAMHLQMNDQDAAVEDRLQVDNDGHLNVIL